MLITDSIYTTNMNPQQRAWFYAEYEQARKDEAVGVLLALFLGCFGLHHFYLRRNGLGVLYLLFFWTGITAILGFIECFLMPGRVRDYNATQATYIAGHILSIPVVHNAATSRCAACGIATEPDAAFCPHCGSSVAPQATA
ncbi:MULTISPECIES: NINE protein [Acidobacteriaceae]|uniref:NINE protein n=1 Tax=Acidobacteriaceae TaxID=204434 RepID=UPI001C20B635|nr:MULTISPECIES: NINE protein [Acidobacteriaceae]MDW5265913.1 NINE protein [Edaphobacter sp.]